MKRSEFWNSIYKTKNENQQSWFQETPKLSLELIDGLNLDKSEAIIDIGGGESRLVDHLIENGYSRVHVLDVSSEALEKAQRRLKEKATLVTFHVCDVLELNLNIQFKLWHDRAVFHFFTQKEDIERYLEIVKRHIAPGGFLILSTFSLSGPDKCSGLPISKYSSDILEEKLGSEFKLLTSFEKPHTTPWGSTQNFVYTLFLKKS